MWKAVFCLLAAAGLLCGTGLLAQPDAEEPGRKSDSSEQQKQIEHGRYLVHHVAQCIQCHTPRTARGDLIVRRLLHGAPIPVRSPYENIPWAFESPRIAGLPGWTDQEIITLLQTGRRPDGQAPRAPMPTFQMTKEDAAAVVAYLNSLAD